MVIVVVIVMALTEYLAREEMFWRGGGGEGGLSYVADCGIRTTVVCAFRL